MTERTRRTVLKAAGATTIAAVAAGCLGDDDDDNGDGDDNGDDDTFEIDAGTEIVLLGEASYWLGDSPDEIDGVENPTLVLEEGEEYTMEWINDDGLDHDLQIWDEDDELLGDEYTTEQMGDEGDSLTLEFTASDEMAAYVCSLHAGSQYGELVVE